MNRPMIGIVVLGVALVLPWAGWAKLPPLTDDQKAKAEEAKAKAAEADKKGAEALAKAQDRVAERYRKEHKSIGVAAKPGSAGSSAAMPAKK